MVTPGLFLGCGEFFEQQLFSLFPRDFPVGPVRAAEQGPLEAGRAVAHLDFGGGQRGDAAAKRALRIAEDAHGTPAHEADFGGPGGRAELADRADIRVFVVAVLQGRDPRPVLRPDGDIVQTLPDHRSRQRTHGGPADEFQKASSVKHWCLLTCGRQSTRCWHWCCQSDWDWHGMLHTATSSWCPGCSRRSCSRGTRAAFCWKPCRDGTRNKAHARRTHDSCCRSPASARHG